MSRRAFLLAALLAALLGLIVFFPLRLAIDLTTGEDSAISAQQVGGTVWDGRIGELGLKGQPLGTFDVSARLLPLLLGHIELDATRLDTGDGPLSARLVTGGGREGIIAANGRLAIRDLVSPLPLEALDLTGVTILFDDGRCSKAQGAVALQPSFAAPIVAESLTGTLSCGDDGRAVATFASQRGGHRVLLNIDAQGGIEAEARTRGAPPAVAVALQVFGYAVEGDELVLRAGVR